MSLPRRELRVLRQIETGIARSDPGMASMMAAFARMTAEEVMPDHERGRSAFVRMAGALVTAAAAVAVVLAHAMTACLRGIPVAAGALWWIGACGSQMARQSSVHRSRYE